MSRSIRLLIVQSSGAGLDQPKILRSVKILACHQWLRKLLKYRCSLTCNNACWLRYLIAKVLWVCSRGKMSNYQDGTGHIDQYRLDIEYVIMHGNHWPLITHVSGESTVQLPRTCDRHGYHTYLHTLRAYFVTWYLPRFSLTGRTLVINSWSYFWTCRRDDSDVIWKCLGQVWALSLIWLAYRAIDKLKCHVVDLRDAEMLLIIFSVCPGLVSDLCWTESKIVWAFSGNYSCRVYFAGLGWHFELSTKGHVQNSGSAPPEWMRSQVCVHASLSFQKPKTFNSEFI